MVLGGGGGIDSVVSAMSVAEIFNFGSLHFFLLILTPAQP